MLFLFVTLLQILHRTQSELCESDVCHYDFVYEMVHTMAYYENPGQYPRNTGSKVFENDDGSLQYIENPELDAGDSRRIVNLQQDVQDFRDHGLMVLDGFDREVAVINSQIPGPTIEVRQDSTISVNVLNADVGGSGLTLHWHGIFQVGTPWMDGVGSITQCNIQSGTNFTYVFTANPWGTFWYHGHTGFRRTDGLYGPVIIHPKQENNAHSGLYDFDQHFITITDWYHEDSEDLVVLHEIGFYVPGEGDELFRFVPEPASFGGFTRTTSEMPYVGGLFDGFGQHVNGDIAGGNLKRFSQYDVQSGKKYRLRFIGAGYNYMYQIGIDKHLFTLIAVDGTDIVAVDDVQYLIIFTGERLDVVLSADQDVGNYWVRATTSEEDPDMRNEVLAVLHYEGASDPRDQTPDSAPMECTAQNSCAVAPCVWEEYPPDYNMKCIHVSELRNFGNYPDVRRLLKDGSFFDVQDFADFDGKKVPQKSDSVKFMNWGAPFQVDGISYHANSEPPLFSDFHMEPGLVCPLGSDGHPYCPQNGCICTNIHNLEFGKVYDFVWYSLKGQDVTTLSIHPIHMHGHAFYVLAEGFGAYDATLRGGIGGYHNTQDIKCLDENCNAAEWADGFQPTLNLDHPPKRDTYSLGPGSWVYVRIVADNPGNWATHCHLELHTPTMMVNFRVFHTGDPNDPLNFDVQRPKSLPQCGNFNLYEEADHMSREAVSLPSIYFTEACKMEYDKLLSVPTVLDSEQKYMACLSQEFDATTCISLLNVFLAACGDQTDVKASTHQVVIEYTTNENSNPTDREDVTVCWPEACNNKRNRMVGEIMQRTSFLEKKPNVFATAAFDVDRDLLGDCSNVRATPSSGYVALVSASVLGLLVSGVVLLVVRHKHAYMYASSTHNLDSVVL